VKKFTRQYLIAGLYSVILLLLAANLFVAYSGMELGRHYSFGWRFYFDRRLNFPFFFSLSLLIVNLVLLYKIAIDKRLTKTQSKFWYALLVTFLVFGIDEAFYIHQHFKMSTFGTIASYDPASWTHYIWVIPYFLVFGILLTILFLRSSVITTSLKNKLLIAGFVFLLGAVGMEFAGTYYAVMRPKADIYILLIKTVEGGLQMTGSVMFINAFLKTYESIKRDD
jgi:hypothetical protein